MIQNLFGDENPQDGTSEEKKHPASGSLEIFAPDSVELSEFSNKPAFSVSTTESESFAETTRRDGLAWSAGIAFFASVVFMLVLGWGADLLLGSSPWGIVCGIVIGSLIGFVQLFRLSTQIFKK